MGDKNQINPQYNLSARPRAQIRYRREDKKSTRMQRGRNSICIVMSRGSARGGGGGGGAVN
jgi:hypothetical protein